MTTMVGAGVFFSIVITYFPVCTSEPDLPNSLDDSTGPLNQAGALLSGNVDL